jgi:hypothetical protein
MAQPEGMIWARATTGGSRHTVEAVTPPKCASRILSGNSSEGVGMRLNLGAPWPQSITAMTLAVQRVPSYTAYPQTQRVWVGADTSVCGFFQPRTSFRLSSM